VSGYALRRLALLPALLFVVSLAVFAMVHALPGDPVDALLGEGAPASRRDELRAAYHLDRPVFIDSGALRAGRIGAAIGTAQYACFVRDLIGGRLRSIRTGEPVGTTLRRRIPYTLSLAAVALLVAVGIAVPAGTLAAARQGSFADRALVALASLGLAMPNYWLGPMLILVFAVGLGWLPVAGADGPQSVVLPALTLGLGMSSILLRMTRAAVLDTLREDYTRTARGKGVGEPAVLVRHALRPALAPIVTVIGLQLGALLGGSVVTEEVFAWPGLGREIVDALRARDFPMIQGCVLLLATTWVTVNTAADLALARIDPRVRLG
jgi:peptide/nickel transport system permease protein